MFLNIVLFLLSLGLLIFIHELGHFTMAKIFKVYVKDFSLGFGPALLKIKGKETQYCLRVLPLGGYVLMYGEQVEEGDLQIPKERSLLGIKKYKRALVMSAGIILNFVLALVLFFVANIGFQQQRITATIAEDSVGANAGILSGEVVNLNAIVTDQLVASINGQDYFIRFTGFESANDDLIDVIEFYQVIDEEIVVFEPSSLTDEVTFYVPVRTYSNNLDYESREVSLTLNAASIDDQYKFQTTGITFYNNYFRYTFTESIRASGQDWWQGFTLIGKAIGNLFIGQGVSEVGGIIAIFSVTSEVYSTLGLGAYIYLWGFISVNLALFNLLPFPGLDGWHLLVIGIEGITRREIPMKIKNAVSMVGVLLLLGLMILLIVRDIFTFF
jgi:regulator of sigma E protease